MAGTIMGGKKAAATNKREHGDDFYKRIGAKGGRNGTIIVPESIESKPYDKNNSYTILSDGNIVLQNGKLATLQKDSKGYLRWQSHLGSTGLFSTEKVHRVIARHFIPNPLNKPQVNHVNGDKTDNRVDNLEWVTNSENAKHARDNNLVDNTSAAMNKLGGQIATAVSEGYMVKDIAELNKISEKTIRRRVYEFTPEPIHSLRLGRRRNYYYYDASRNKWRVESTEKYKGSQFDTEAEANNYIKSFSSLGGFAANPELAKIAGAKGGKVSKRKRSEVAE